MIFAADTYDSGAIAPMWSISSIDTVTYVPTLRRHFQISPGTAIDTSVDSTPINWLSESLLQLNSLAALENNWDGEGSLPISTAMLESAAALLFSIAKRSHDVNVVLPIPHVAPIPGGALQLEWRAYRRYLELEFVTPNSVRAVARKGRSIRSLGTVGLVKPKLRRILDFLS